MRSKCEPILGHMLKGLNDENPIRNLHRKVLKQFMKIRYFVVNKPHEFLSVPEKPLKISITQLLISTLNSTGPIIVHRLVPHGFS